MQRSSIHQSVYQSTHQSAQQSAHQLAQQSAHQSAQHSAHKAEQQSVHQSTKKNNSTDKSIQNSINRSSKNETKLKDASNRTNFEKSNKQNTKRKSKMFYDRSHYLTDAIIEEPDDESRKNMGHTEVIESLASDYSKNLRLSSSFSRGSNYFEKSSEKIAKSSKDKNISSKIDQTKNSNNFKSMNKANKSEKSSLSNDLLSLDNGKSSSMKSKRKSRSLKVLRSSNASNKTHESPRKSILKKSISRIKSITRSKIDDLSDVSLILNSTKESNDANDLVELKTKEDESKENLNDISVTGFETNLTLESDFEVVFDEKDNSQLINEPVESKNLTNSRQFSKFDDEIEQQRNSMNQKSLPEISLVQTSISETLSQPESMKKSLEKANMNLSKSKTTNKSKSQLPTSTNFDLSIDFNSEDEDVNLKSINEKMTDRSIKEPQNSRNEINSLRSTPKSILKTTSKSKCWEASDFSLVNLTIDSSKKSISNHASFQKTNSVRFSDKVSEKFANGVLSSRNEEEKEDEIESNKNNKMAENSSKEKELNDLPDLNDLNGYSNNETSKSSSSKKVEESLNKEESSIGKINESEESLNVTIDDLSLLDEELEKESLNMTANKTPTDQLTKNQSTFIVKSLKKPEKKQKFKNMIKKLDKIPKYYETFVDKTPTIIYPQIKDDQAEAEEERSVRRSKRIRVRPLDFWRSQKPKYKLDKNTKCLTIEGIDKGFAIDNPFRKRRTRSSRSKSKKGSKQQKRKREEASDDENINEVKMKKIRYEPNEISIHQEINKSAIEISEKIKKEATEFCSQNDLEWTESKQSKGVFMAFMSRRKDRNGNTQATGFMKLTSLLKKPTQKSANYVTRYVVMFGCASVVIGKNSNNLKI